MTRERQPWLLVECKSNNETPTKTLYSMTKLLKPAHAVQLVDRQGFDRFYKESGVRVVSIETFLAGSV